MPGIPLNDLNAQHLELQDELFGALRGVVESSRFIGGPDLNAFASEFADFCDVGHAVPCGSGTDALLLAILGVCGMGDRTREIVTSTYTFAAAAEAITLLGYRPVLVDIDPKTYLMNLEQVTDVVSASTAAVIPVDLFGQMVAPHRLREIADPLGIPIIEDAAQAHGAKLHGVGPGQASTAATFSFFPGKNLGAWGDAGAVVTQDPTLARAMHALADHGRTHKNQSDAIGLNARMDNLQAAVLRVKLRHLSKWNQSRCRVADAYRELLADVPGCTLPAVAEGAEHVYHQFVLRLEDRDQVVAALKADDIGFGIHYALPIHEQKAYAFLGLAPEDLPEAHLAARQCLSLPMYPHLPPEQVERVCRAVRSACHAKVVA